MKKIFKISITLLVAVGCFMCALYLMNRSGYFEKFITQELTIMADVTEENMGHLPLSELAHASLIPPVSTKDDEGSGEHIRIVPINQFNINASIEATIKPVRYRGWFSNELDRKRERMAYWKKTDEALTQLFLERSNLEGSSIYIPLARELNRMSAMGKEGKMKSNYKKLVIMSDGFEASKVSNFYDEIVFRKLQMNPDMFIEAFNEHVKLESLNGIEIIWIYKARNRDESEKFEVISKFYEKMLTQKGASFFVSASL